MARRWHKFAAKQRKRISFPRSSYHGAESCSIAFSIVDKGHSVVYTTDQKQLVVPLAYLQHEVIGQLGVDADLQNASSTCISGFKSMLVSLIPTRTKKPSIASAELTLISL
ncbi:auxin-responsive protein SAUR68-like [Solanum stenotomum]|uniref:auxin-responsive protein SAUR68-like n=1 Tax=Solanum stenotomum TaxID=172797 RepID=UPI0020D198E0|nr:auxin-responsive protein SAUR68-like [Solanum stenotomum]